MIVRLLRATESTNRVLRAADEPELDDREEDGGEGDEWKPVSGVGGTAI